MIFHPSEVHVRESAGRQQELTRHSEFRASLHSVNQTPCQTQETSVAVRAPVHVGRPVLLDKLPVLVRLSQWANWVSNQCANDIPSEYI